MTDTFEFTLNNPLTEEQWDMIEDVDFDRTDRIWFHTKHGKEVEFVKVIRCKDCKHMAKDRDYRDGSDVYICNFNHWRRSEGKRRDDFYCADGERKDND